MLENDEKQGEPTCAMLASTGNKNFDRFQFIQNSSRDHIKGFGEPYIWQQKNCFIISKEVKIYSPSFRIISLSFQSLSTSSLQFFCNCLVSSFIISLIQFLTIYNNSLVRPGCEL